MVSSIAPRRWTRDEYDRMVDAGILHDDEEVELIEGEILQMTPQKRPHAAAVLLVTETLRRAFGEQYTVQPQVPLAVSDDSEPEPDIAVVAGAIRDFRDLHPTTAVLIVEVADSSLVFDRRRKARIYAGAGIAEYWIVNLVDRCVEVHRDAAADEAGGEPRYGNAQLIDPAGFVSPLSRPDARIAVSDLLP
jgi:Uma2 family endonuclease